MSELALGLLTGIVFGVLLQKGQAAKHAVIVGQLLFRDWTVAKIMGTAVVVGAVGVFFLVELGVTTLSVKPAAVGGLVLGGILFGIGMAVLGLCPGTTVAGAGEGQRDAMVGVLGGLCGAAFYVIGFGWVSQTVARFPDLGKVTLHQMTDTSPWLWVSALVLGLLAALAWTHLGRLSSRTPATGRLT